MDTTAAVPTPAPLTTAERLVIRGALLSALMPLYETALKLHVYPDGTNEPELRDVIATTQTALAIIER